ncbi:MAG: ABC transporter substrate-binding protein [Gomphosphaeria aponina SAG 52.96 = DSM 107014]|uniref:ABC transporter substrate-binding protein n=1 Tax=Gomphosphaeria aponina SAG 52.96 = DSM 107014 TaxID=1521640 RepID=A0A941GVV2_9CHRO|nr:ABC transporter substrate-binding protein [Gomphosphaeria aponina SAG 52.96 = DSM 107014]
MRFFCWLTLTLALIITCSLTACNSAFLASKATQENQIVQAILSDPKTFNALLSQESPNIFGLTYEGLITENPLTGENEPALAKSWEISEDKLEIIFTLREGLQWSDGKPLTADDVVFSYNQLYLNEAIPSNARDSLRIGESGALPTVTKIDDLRVKFTIPEPFAPFLGSTGLSILPAHILQAAVATKGADGNPKFLTTWGVDTPPEQIIVNGPYKLEKYQTSQRLIFTRNPYYWKKDDQGNQLPYLERVIWEIVESTDTSVLQFRSGSLDSLGVSPDYFSLLKREENRGNFTIYNGGPAYGMTYVSFNLNKGKRNGKPLVDPVKSRWFNNVNFRKAIAYGIDRQRMINNIYRGLGEAQNSPISVQSPFYYAGVKSYDYNPELAKKLLLQEGFKYNEEGQLLDAEGNRVRFTLMTNAGNEVREALGSQIQQDLSKIGIQVDFTPIAFNVMVDKLSNSLEWESHIIGFTGGNEPHGAVNLWFPDGNLHMFNQKPQAGRDSIQGREVAPWEQRIADLYIAAARELNKEKRQEIYAETQGLAQEYLPMIYLVNPLSLTAVRDRIQGIEYSALGGAFWNIDQLQIKE